MWKKMSRKRLKTSGTMIKAELQDLIGRRKHRLDSRWPVTKNECERKLQKQKEVSQRYFVAGVAINLVTVYRLEYIFL